MTAVDAVTPYSTVKPLLSSQDLEQWVPELDRDRIASYAKYEEIYWNVETAFKLVTRGLDQLPIYVPNPRTICDTTAHFWMKGLDLNAEGVLKAPLDALQKRETLLSKFHTAKHSGVVRGDFLFHMTADMSKPAGSRISITSLDPAMYFPECDDDDLDKIVAVNVVEQILDKDQPSRTMPVIHLLRYEYVMVNGRKRVASQEGYYEVKDWFKGTRVQLKELRPPKLLPERISVIPVYHFKNIDWQGQPFGSSELRGHEMVQAAIDQAITDEHVALALEGLGVYATDAGRPVNASGVETDWEISPGRVVEVPSQAEFKRVQGLSSVKPFQDHLEFLVNSMYEATGTFRAGVIDAQVAQSGIALAVRFLPTVAKLENRDQSATDKLQQMMYDWKSWLFVYENLNTKEDDEVVIKLGDKLPLDPAAMLNVINNALDRRVISREYYREQLTVIYGLTFPDDIEAQIQEDVDKFMPAPLGETERETIADTPDAVTTDAKGTPIKQNNSNNKNAPNESKGTEAK